jgi:hypothetical protein
MNTVFFNRYRKVLSHNIYDTDIPLQSTKSPPYTSGTNYAGKCGGSRHPRQLQGSAV